MDRERNHTHHTKTIGRLFAMVAVVAAACQGEASDPGATGRAAAADQFSPWPGDGSLRIAAEPSLVVGSDESLPLGRVSGAVFFGDGIAIADVQSDEVLILDAAGRLLSRHGRYGDGPGDYKFLNGIARHAGGLITWDANLFRVTLLDASGGYVGDTTLRPRRGWSRIVGAFGNSVLLEISELGFPGAAAVGPMEIRLPVEYEIARLSDGEVVFEGTRPGVEKWATREVHGDGGQTHGGLPVIFGRTAVAAVTDRYAYLATTDSITITRYDEAGTAVEVSSFEQPRARAEAAWVRFVRDTTRAHLESRGPGQIVIGGRNFMEVMTESRLRLLEDLPARPTLPAFSAMKGGADGLLWIREYPDPFQDQVAWVGFNEAWERKKRIAMPASLRILDILDISEDRVLVRAKGAHDETLIKVYPIER